MVVDLDNILAFNTPKIIIIKDRWLGLIKYIAMLAAAVYFLIFRLWLNESYLKLLQYRGVATYTLEEPDTVTQARHLSYCSQYEGSALAEQQNVCLRLPHEFILHGSRSSEVRLTTFFEQRYINISRLQDTQSKDGIGSCESLGQGQYVMEAEKYSLKVHHTINRDSSDKYSHLLWERSSVEAGPTNAY